jgi:restriction endonuclease
MADGRSGKDLNRNPALLYLWRSKKMELDLFSTKIECPDCAEFKQKARQADINKAVKNKMEDIADYIKNRLKTLEKEKMDIQMFSGHGHDYVYAAKMYELKEVLKLLKV